MKSKLLLLGLLLVNLVLIGCDKDDYSLKDRVETVTLYVSSETGTYQPWGAEQPVECMRVKEPGETEYQPLAFGAIAGFVYEKGYDYTLSVEKTTLSNPPADASRVTYKLLQIVEQTIPTTE